MGMMRSLLSTPQSRFQITSINWVTAKTAPISGGAVFDEICSLVEHMGELSTLRLIYPQFQGTYPQTESCGLG